MNTGLRIALLGFGEVGQILATDLRARGVEHIAVWDTQFANSNSGPSRAAQAARITIAGSARDAVADAALVISAVTAAQDLAAAEAAAPHLTANAYFLDLNSVSPAVKQTVADVITRAGGRYVEAAVMAPIQPRRSASPMLLGGPHAQAFAELAQPLGFTGAEVFDTAIGKASAAKMCRSVVIKGMEALLAEALLAGRHYGVEQTVLESLRAFMPAVDWHDQARYMLARALQHGARRAEEMREVSQTVRDAGLEPWMSRACVARQAWAAQYGELAHIESLERMLDEWRAKQALAGMK